MDLRWLSWTLIGLCCMACSKRPPAAAFIVERLATPAASGSGQSHLAVAPDGSVVMSWVEPVTGGHALRLAGLHGSEWSAPATVAEGSDWFVNWADFPSVVPISGRLWAAHWLRRQSAGGYAYDIAVALSTDGGASWGAAFTPHTDGTATEHGFVTLFPWQEGVGLVWLDGRNMTADAGSHESAHGAAAAGMTLRAAVLDAAAGRHREALVDDLTCDCCQTAVAIGAEGPIVAYRDRSTGEIRDIVVTRATGTAWSKPVPVAGEGWRIEGCPVNGPAIAARGSAVIVAWFTAASDLPRVRMARSADAGRHFGPAIDLDTRAPLGRVALALLDDGDAAVGWLAADAEGAAVVLRRIAPDGTLGPVRVIGRTAAARPSGFPQMVASGGGLIVSWTDVTDGATRILTARVPTEGL